MGPQFHPIDQEIQDLYCGPIRCEQTEEVRNIPQKRQRELSKRGLKGDWKMWCPDAQEKQMARKGTAHRVQWCEEFVLIRFQNCHSSGHMGAKPDWIRCKSGEELQSMRKTHHFESSTAKKTGTWWYTQGTDEEWDPGPWRWSVFCPGSPSMVVGGKGKNQDTNQVCRSMLRVKLRKFPVRTTSPPRPSAEMAQWERRCGKSKEKRDV